MPKPLTLLNRFDRLNRRHFRGKLKRPSMVRFSKQPASDDVEAVGRTIFKSNGQVCILIHAGLKPFTTLTELVLAHEMAHQWNHQRGVKGEADNCHKRGSRHHCKVLSILSKEPTLC